MIALNDYMPGRAFYPVFMASRCVTSSGRCEAIYTPSLKTSLSHTHIEENGEEPHGSRIHRS
jgi:hypothetical protein